MDTAVKNSTGTAETEAIGVVRSFLEALGRRDLAFAQTLLGEGTVMVFPGDNRFTRMADLAEQYSKPRYRKVNKRFERFEALPTDRGTVVYVSGRLYGEWPDGNAFDNIRYIDRFLIAGGLIREQEVWNDLAEMRPKPI